MNYLYRWIPSVEVHTFLSTNPDAFLSQMCSLQKQNKIMHCGAWQLILFSTDCCKCKEWCNAQRCTSHPGDGASLRYRHNSAWNQHSSSPRTHRAETPCAQLQQTKTSCSKHCLGWTSACIINVKIYKLIWYWLDKCILAILENVSLAFAET